MTVRRGAYQKTSGRMSDLRRIRMALGVSQEGLAIMAGCSVRAVREHERSDWPSSRASGRSLHHRLLAALAR